MPLSYTTRLLAEAARLRGLEFGICRILAKEKVPTYKGWTRASLEPDHFKPYPDANIGILGGTLSSNLAIVDPDRAEIRAEAAKRLPRTMTDGRPSSGPGHYYYRVTDVPSWATAGPNVAGGIGGPRIFHFADADGRPIGLDFLGTGAQAVCPPSLHHSGERRCWIVEPEHIVTLPYLELWAIVKQLAKDFGAANADREGARPAVAVTGKPRVFVDNIVKRAIAYLAECPPAVSGQGGHNRTFAVARAIVWGFDLGADAGFDLLQQHYNPRCEPPWSDAELMHKCEDADCTPFDKPRGWLLDQGVNSVNSVNSQVAEPETAHWPDPPAPEAYHGLPGIIVKMLDPHTEADPVALLVQTLLAFGSAAGRYAHFVAEGDGHYVNEFAVMVGRTSKGRKGVSWGRVRSVFDGADEEWASKRVVSGLSSGEGLIHQVRDPLEKLDEAGNSFIVDPGESDKRLLCLEPEFASILKHAERQGNILSAVLRQAWENGNLRTLTKHSPTRATGAHTSVIGHCTAEELTRYLAATEMANGLGNRFMWVCVRRSKCLPDGGSLHPNDLAELQRLVRSALEYARHVDTVRRDDSAAELWREVYPKLSEGKPGLAGALLGRSEAHTMRLATIYALMNRSAVISAEHLRAALALWNYCERSIAHIFGDSTGNPTADEILRQLRACPDGLTRTEIHQLLGGHKSAATLGKALGLLLESKLATFEKIKSGEAGGRPGERWRANKPN